MSRPCPCTSKRLYPQCCEPYLTGKKVPETAEQLMRSRFSAYAMQRPDYLIATTAAKERAELDAEELKAYCKEIKCISLKVISTEGGGKSDREGKVLFHASLQYGGRRVLHRELSTFTREEGRWVYVDGETD
nr:YchJ family metal-binding protein [uncultured Holophaga sp.]